ncbi:MAG: bifunctional phosphopantothenoylcysteine decarboxylase/phosphopantothenate--cysteine ligase CoaBC [Bacillota bacterium]|nr:bifunctional phosphopantothenoylcysteine decarboxylase/phosphopantothenate--cysteine ligase CoaBC [Bacillota bacterium]
MLKNKTVLLGVSGGIACFKAVALASALVKLNCDVQVVMTKNACEFVSPLSFEAITSNDVYIDTFENKRAREIDHISLADRADLVVIAPATANVIAKLANGIADDMLTSTVLACDCPKMICPAMNTRMYENPVTQDNLKKLEHYGWEILEADSGVLACGTIGKGRLPESEYIKERILHKIGMEKIFEGLNILVTAGATKEAIDPVRFITNHSSGKMGYSIAKIAAAMGANVTLISGNATVDPPAFTNFIKVNSAVDMFEEVKKYSPSSQIVIMCAAVADYTPKTVSEHKIKKGKTDELVLELKRNPDILKYLGEHREENQFLCGFAMETRDLIENAGKKLREKNVDMIVANSLKDEGAGFQTDTNLVTILSRDEQIKVPLMDKSKVAERILKTIKERMEFGQD